ncbi:hypothetical protein F5Y04DRAFT_278782 [Hypomontagnella monticulosa]|nr:hypothetical protein F5Y04DRAFT_278782 [Hypomontagnella monticulosa]
MYAIFILALVVYGICRYFEIKATTTQAQATREAAAAMNIQFNMGLTAADVQAWRSGWQELAGYRGKTDEKLHSLGDFVAVHSAKLSATRDATADHAELDDLKWEVEHQHTECKWLRTELRGERERRELDQNSSRRILWTSSKRQRINFPPWKGIGKYGRADRVGGTNEGGRSSTHS